MPDDLQEDILVPEPGAMFTCTCTNDDGSICNKSFKSYVQLHAHMVHSRAGGHGERPVHALAAVTNACPWCKHKFASRCTSKEHSVEVHVGGKARHVNPEIVPSATLDCPVCQHSCAGWVILLRMTIPLRSLSGKRGMRMCSKRLKVGSATCWLFLVLGMAAPSWLITGLAHPPPARRPRLEGSANGFSPEAQKKLLVLLAKTVLKHSLDRREMQSAVLTALIANRDSDLTSAATSVTQGRNARAADLRKAGKIVSWSPWQTPCAPVGCSCDLRR